MSRFHTYGYGHYCVRHNGSFGIVWFEIGWKYDRYYKNSRLRHPTTISRQTDKSHARKFCKKWEIEFPEGKEKQ